MQEKAFIFVLCLVCNVAAPLCGQASNGAVDTQATVFGTVHAVMPTAPDLVPSERPVQGVKVTFETKDGKTVTARTNQSGEYKAVLSPEIEYTVTVSFERERLFSPLHRPGFVPKANAQIRFDFTIAQIVLVETLYGADGKKLPYPFHYQEHRQPVEGTPEREMIIACGKSTDLSNGGAWYEPLPSTFRHGQDRLRVTVMFDTYTVRADDVKVSRQTKRLVADGDVTIEDGSAAPPRTESCVVFRLDDPDKGFRPCSKRTTTPH
jgi:hypothetical protein